MTKSQVEVITSVERRRRWSAAGATLPPPLESDLDTSAAPKNEMPSRVRH
jgi:hypothetical protein